MTEFDDRLAAQLEEERRKAEEQRWHTERHLTFASSNELCRTPDHLRAEVESFLRALPSNRHQDGYLFAAPPKPGEEETCWLAEVSTEVPYFKTDTRAEKARKKRERAETLGTWMKLGTPVKFVGFDLHDDGWPRPIRITTGAAYMTEAFTRPGNRDWVINGLVWYANAFRAASS